MKGDFTRHTFRPEKHYSSVRWQQGRVGPLDAEWNEQRDIDDHRDRTTHRDVIGDCGGPLGKDPHGNDLAGFRIATSGANLSISAGRFYVRGMLCENETETLLSGQDDLPDYPLPKEAGVYLAYLDVWERHITALEDPGIREVALGGPDTTTRTRVVWQVRLERVGDPGAALQCSAFGPAWRPAGAASTGTLAARAQPDPGSTDPCIVPAKAGYRRLENQLYRVEIHQGGALDTATFKWSRENGSVVTPWLDQDGDNLTVASVGRDRWLGFSAGDWVELSDDTRELHGKPGVLVRLNRVEGEVLGIDPATIEDPDDPDDPAATGVDRSAFLRNPKIRRWESEAARSVTIPADNDGWIALEDGVEIRFQAGVYRPGDYWTIPARSAEGKVLWPEDAGGGPEFQARNGTRHHYCPLALAEFDGAKWSEPSDCRKLFPPLTELPGAHAGCCEVTVGDGVRSVGDFQDIQAAVDSLDGGGTVCLLPGEYRLATPLKITTSRLTLRGCGRRSRIVAAAGESALLIDDSRELRLQALWIETAADTAAIRIEGGGGIEVHDCTVRNKTGPALQVAAAREIEIHHNRLFGRPALLLQAGDGTVRDNQLRGGGLWLWEGSARLLVEANVIAAGDGPGIVLGGLPEGRKPPREAVGLTGIEIRGNRIRAMGGSGIATSFDVVENRELGEIDALTIAGNRIENCARTDPDPRFDSLAAGGIVLRHVKGLRVHDNRIDDNGGERSPACGIFVHTAVGMEIIDNRVTGNGAAQTAALRCIDFRDREPDTSGANPRQGDGAQFTVFEFDGNSSRQTRIAMLGRFVGLDCRARTDIELPAAVPTATLTLVSFAQPGTVEARDDNDQIVAQAVMSGNQGVAETLELQAAGIRRLVVNALGNKLLILETCFGERAAGFQAGIVAWQVLDGLAISGNRVDCPAGQALIATALGSVSIIDNRFRSGREYRQPVVKEKEWDAIAQLGRCVSVYGAGLTPLLGDASLGVATSVVSHVESAVPSLFGALAKLPGGPLLFHGNQVHLELEAAEQESVSVSLNAGDDVAVQDNQLSVSVGQGRLLVDLLVVAPTVRVTANRFTELPEQALLSCWSQGKLQNITADNQATHCVLAQGGEVVARDNQVQFSAACKELLGRLRADSD